MPNRDSEKVELSNICDALAEAAGAAKAIIRAITLVDVADTIGTAKAQTKARDRLDAARERFVILRREVREVLTGSPAQTKSKDGALFDNPNTRVEVDGVEVHSQKEMKREVASMFAKEGILK